jgi:hypothetical protein
MCIIFYRYLISKTDGRLGTRSGVPQPRPQEFRYLILFYYSHSFIIAIKKNYLRFVNATREIDQIDQLFQLEMIC